VTARELSIYMDPVEVAQLSAALHVAAPRVALEWGAGGSTAFLLREVKSLELLASIEHDAAWFENVGASIDDPRLQLRCVVPDVPPTAEELRIKRGQQVWDARAEQEPALMATYVATADSFGSHFDFVFVDGRARRFCLRRGWELLRPGGLMVLHDAQRTEYHDAIPTAARTLFLKPWVRGQLCLMVKRS